MVRPSAITISALNTVVPNCSGSLVDPKTELHVACRLSLMDSRNATPFLLLYIHLVLILFFGMQLVLVSTIFCISCALLGLTQEASVIIVIN